MSKVEILRKKLELAEKQEQGLVLMADDEEWLDVSDTEDQAQMCFMGLMEEESDDEEEEASDPQMVNDPHFIEFKNKLLEMTNPIHLKNQELEIVISKQTQELTDLTQQRDNILSMVDKLNESVSELEYLQQQNKVLKSEIEFLTLNRDLFSKEGLGFKNPQYLKKALEEKPAFYNLTDLRMSARFPILKGSEMKEEFSEMQEIKKHDPLYHGEKYHRVKFVYSSDNLKIKSPATLDSSNAFLQSESQWESDGTLKPYVPTLELEKKISELENKIQELLQQNEALISKNELVSSVSNSIFDIPDSKCDSESQDSSSKTYTEGLDDIQENVVRVVTSDGYVAYKESSALSSTDVVTPFNLNSVDDTQPIICESSKSLGNNQNTQSVKSIHESSSSCVSPEVYDNSLQDEILCLKKTHESVTKQFQNTIKQLRVELAQHKCDSKFWSSKCSSLTKSYDRLVERLSVYEEGLHYAGKNQKIVAPPVTESYIKNIRFTQGVQSMLRHFQKQIDLKKQNPNIELSEKSEEASNHAQSNPIKLKPFDICANVSTDEVSFAMKKRRQKKTKSQSRKQVSSMQFSSSFVTPSNRRSRFSFNKNHVPSNNSSINKRATMISSKLQHLDETHTMFTTASTLHSSVSNFLPFRKFIVLQGIKYFWDPISRASHKWYLDSGCSKHMTGRKEILSNYKEEYGGSVKFGNNELAPVVGQGDVVCKDITIKNVAHVVGLNHNLFSIGKFCDKDLEVYFKKRRCVVRTEEGKELLVGSRRTNLYTIRLQHKLQCSSSCLITRSSLRQAVLWHKRLSHLNFRYIDKIVKHQLVSGIPMIKFEQEEMCPGCEKGKMKRASHPPKPEQGSKSPLSLLHMDLCGPMKYQSLAGHKYILVIVDDFSRYTWTKFLKTKDETSSLIINFIKAVQVQLKLLVQTVRTDNDMADYDFPDTESLEIPHIISERTSMHQPHLDVDRQLLQAALFLEEKSNNVVYSVHAKTKAPVIAEILKHHPLFVPLTKEVAVPLIYVQQAWKLLEFHETEARCYYTTKIDHFTISFGLNKFRHLMGFPSATSRPGAVQFEPFDSLDEALASVRSIGYQGDLHTSSAFNKTNLPPTYNTLFTILNRCLTGKKTAHDTAPQSMFLLFQGVLFNRHYDYAALIFHDMQEFKGRKPNHLAYPCFLSILIASAMEQNPEIPRRLNSVKVKSFPFQSVRYPPTVFAPEVPLFGELLAYADQGVKCVREYREKHASMVQPEPAGPSQGAILRSEGLVIRDQRSRDPGQGVQRENTERGLGGDLPDQPAHSSTANVAAHIGQISLAVQMDDVFAAADDEHAVNQPFIQEQEDDQLVDYELSPLDMNILESFGEHEVEPPQVQVEQPVPLYTPVEMDQRLTILMGYESSGSVSSEDTLILPSDSDAACDMDAQTEELPASDDDDSDDDDMPDQGSSRLLTLGVIRTDEGALVENPEVRMSEGDVEKHGESEIGARKEVQTPPQAESSWVPTSTRGEHLLPPPIDQDMRSPLMQCTTQLSHSTVSQQTVVSSFHGVSPQLVPIPHLEVGGTDTVRQLPPPTTSLPITSSLDPIASDVTLSLVRTPVQTTFAGGFNSPAGTTVVSSAFVAGLQGSEGNPISVNITPTLNMGSLGFTLGSTRSLSDLSVSLPSSTIITELRQQSTILGSSSTPVGSFSSASASASQSSTVPASSASTTPSTSVPPQHGSSSSPDIDLSRIHVVATANQLITRSLFRANNEQMATVIQQQTARISALEKQVAALAKGKAPMPDPPTQPSQSAADSLSIPELKGLLFSKLLEAGASEDIDLVEILQQQTALQQRAIQEQRSQSHLVTHTEFQ
ncbi:hypothetical protein OSB04_un000287 [Centaurea solstitialis]|uniref:Integrase catalytic domain-containing protein n=1 Tax=Centaurea solstitialis TaxID=347529 RepID=A0AA38S5E8_9ASTR|nr:hypothetical protein OSB04_un000287 [Centaurea solstitialis]